MTWDEPELAPGVTIEPGAVRVSYVSPFDIGEPGRRMRVWTIDMHTKYAELYSYTQGGGEIVIWLMAAEHTIKLDEAFPRETPTVLTLPLPGLPFEEWQVVADTYARYSLRVVAYQVPEGE